MIVRIQIKHQTVVRHYCCEIRVIDYPYVSDYIFIDAIPLPNVYLRYVGLHKVVFACLDKM